MKIPYCLMTKMDVNDGRKVCNLYLYSSSYNSDVMNVFWDIFEMFKLFLRNEFTFMASPSQLKSCNGEKFSHSKGKTFPFSFFFLSSLAQYFPCCSRHWKLSDSSYYWYLHFMFLREKERKRNVRGYKLREFSRDEKIFLKNYFLCFFLIKKK